MKFECVDSLLLRKSAPLSQYLSFLTQFNAKGLVLILHIKYTYKVNCTYKCQVNYVVPHLLSYWSVEGTIRKTHDQGFQFLMEFVLVLGAQLSSQLLYSLCSLAMKLEQFSELESMNHILVYKELQRECKPSWWIFWKRIGSTGKTISGEIACVPVGQYLKMNFGLSTYSSDWNTVAFLSVNPACLCKGKRGHNLYFYWNRSFFPPNPFIFGF